MEINLSNIDELVEASINNDNTAVTTDNHDNQEDVKNKILDKENISNEANARYRGAKWFDEISKLSVTLVGLGGIGSHTAFQLSRLNFKTMSLFDYDKVEGINLSGQLYSIHDMFALKTEAIWRMLSKYSPQQTNVSTFNVRAENVTEYNSDIFISGLDNMGTRKFLFDKWENNGIKSDLFIDGRLSADSFQIFSMQKTDNECKKIYKDKYLFQDSEGDNVVCSFKQTTYMASMIASMICNIIINYVVGKMNDVSLIPFMTEYDSNIMQLKIK